MLGFAKLGRGALKSKAQQGETKDAPSLQNTYEEVQVQNSPARSASLEIADGAASALPQEGVTDAEAMKRSITWNNMTSIKRWIRRKRKNSIDAAALVKPLVMNRLRNLHLVRIFSIPISSRSEIDVSQINFNLGYFNEPWNCLDFLIVVESVTAVILRIVAKYSNGDANGGAADFSALRALRVLRPLRSVNHLPGLRLLVKSMMESLPQLANAILGFLLYFVSFTLLGIQLFQGSLQKRCYYAYEYMHYDSNSSVSNSSSSSSGQMLVTGGGFDIARVVASMHTGGGLDEWVTPEEDGLVCGGAWMCPMDRKSFSFNISESFPSSAVGMVRMDVEQACLPSGRNPHYGYTSFDNLFAGSLSIFQCLTLEGWSDILHLTQDAMPNHNFVTLYFVPMVLCGAYILLNLVLAVIVSKFRESNTDYRQKVTVEHLAEYEFLIARWAMGGKWTALHKWKATVAWEQECERLDRVRVLARKTVEERLQKARRKLQITTAFSRSGASLRSADTRRATFFRRTLFGGGGAVSPAGNKGSGRGRRTILSPMLGYRGLGRTGTRPLAGFDEADLPDLAPKRRSLVLPETRRSMVRERRRSSRKRHTILSPRTSMLSAAQLNKVQALPSNAVSPSSSITSAGAAPRKRETKFAVDEPTQQPKRAGAVGFAPMVDTNVKGAGKLKTASPKARRNRHHTVNLGSCGREEQAASFFEPSSPSAATTAITAAVTWRKMAASAEKKIQSDVGEEEGKVEEQEQETTRPSWRPDSTQDRKDIPWKPKSTKGQEGAEIAYETTGGANKTGFVPVQMVAYVSDDAIEQELDAEVMAYEEEGKKGSDQHQQLWWLVESAFFTQSIYMLIFLNTVALSIEHHGMDPGLADTLRIANFVFTVAFTFEMCLKITAYGWRGYTRDAMNVFDATIVVISLIELALDAQQRQGALFSGGNDDTLTFSGSDGQASDDGGSAKGTAAFRIMRLLRLLRILRVAKLARYMAAFQHLISVVTRSLASVGFVSLLLFLFMLVFSVLGMQLFGGAFDGPYLREHSYLQSTAVGGPMQLDKPRMHFDTFHHSFITVFVLLTTEGWNEVMFHAMYATHPSSALYFVSWICVGRFIVLNIFLAVLLQASVDIIQTELKKSKLASKQGALEEEVERKGKVKKSKRHILTKVGSVTAFMNAGKASKEGEAREATTSSAVNRMAMRAAKAAKAAKASIEAKDAEAALSSTSTASPEEGEATSIAAKDELRCSEAAEVKSSNTMGDGPGPPGSEPSSSNGQTSPKGPPVAAVIAERRCSQTLQDSHDHLQQPAPALEAEREEQQAPPPPKSLFERRISQQAQLQLEQPEQPSSPEGKHWMQLAQMRAQVRFMVREGSTFDSLVLLLILCSSLALGYESPRVEADEKAMAQLGALEIVFTTLFTIEMMLKIFGHGIGCGLVVGSSGIRDDEDKLKISEAGRGYLSNGWNQLDFVVVTTSLLSLTLESSLSSLRILRILRCLRPLRMIRRNEGLKVVVNSLLLSTWPVMNVMLLALLVWLMFAIMGVQLFAGQFGYCTDPSFPAGTPKWGIYNSSYDNSLDSTTSELKQWLVLPCEHPLRHAPPGTLSAPPVPTGFLGVINSAADLPGSESSSSSSTGAVARWVTYQSSFDNVPAAMLTLFVVASMEGWHLVMFHATDGVGADQQPARDNNILASYYFLCFVLLGSFFMISLFATTIFENFIKLKQHMEGFGFLNSEQQKWVEMHKRLSITLPVGRVRAPHITPKSSMWDRVRFRCWRLANDERLEVVVCALIVVNVILLASSHYSEPCYWTIALEASNMIFAVLFTLEAVVKIVGLSPKHYFKDNWNNLDFALVLVSLIDLMIIAAAGDSTDDGSTSSCSSAGSSGVTAFRILRLVRAVRLVRTVPGIRAMFLTIWLSLPSLLNVGSLLLLLFYIFAVLGVAAFGNATDGEFIHRHSNFRSVPAAMVLLFSVSTGEGWQDIMFELDADPSVSGGVPVTYFVIFVTLGSYVLTNLFIMVLIDNFESVSSHAKGVCMSELDLIRFKRAWSALDPESTGFIKAHQIEPLLRMLHHMPHRIGITIRSTAFENGSTPMGVEEGATLAAVKRRLGDIKGQEQQQLDQLDTNGSSDTRLKRQSLVAAQKIATTSEYYPHSDDWYRRLAICATNGQLQFNEVLGAMHLAVYGSSLNSDIRNKLREQRLKNFAQKRAKKEVAGHVLTSLWSSMRSVSTMNSGKGESDRSWARSTRSKGSQFNRDATQTVVRRGDSARDTLPKAQNGAVRSESIQQIHRTGVAIPGGDGAKAYEEDVQSEAEDSPQARQKFIGAVTRVVEKAGTDGANGVGKRRGRRTIRELARQAMANKSDYQFFGWTDVTDELAAHYVQRWYRWHYAWKWRQEQHEQLQRVEKQQQQQQQQQQPVVVVEQKEEERRPQLEQEEQQQQSLVTLPKKLTAAETPRRLSAVSLVPEISARATPAGPPALAALEELKDVGGTFGTSARRPKSLPPLRMAPQ
jgi:hypothetical protein